MSAGVSTEMCNPARSVQATVQTRRTASPAPDDQRRMTSAPLACKGRITIRADVRRALNVQTGDRVEFVQIGSEHFEIVASIQDPLPQIGGTRLRQHPALSGLFDGVR